MNNQAYEILDSRKLVQKMAPIGIAVPIPGWLELWLSDGRAVRLDVDDAEVDKPPETLTVYTDDGMVTLVPLKLDSFYENVAPFMDIEGISFASDAELNAHYAQLCREG